ncbi:hypothetical protein GCM10009733_038290 [Nonomuraea maheshkhaliensis]|uniref:Uncharacterized protein n=1 Tax=Nonomuraea maheshkhaliensis TaxID=419590 RepID=A0ABN2FA87_9ACTN
MAVGTEPRHPWVGAEPFRQPWRPALLDFYESVGRLPHALAVPERARFDAAGALVNCVLGVAVQNAARPGRGPKDKGRCTDQETGRADFLAGVASLNVSPFERRLITGRVVPRVHGQPGRLSLEDR